jgi:hypothetical protein
VIAFVNLFLIVFGLDAALSLFAEWTGVAAETSSLATARFAVAGYVLLATFPTLIAIALARIIHEIAGPAQIRA